MPTQNVKKNQDHHPLGLTVHSLPTPEETFDPQRQLKNGRLKMLLVMMICAAPVVASYFTYYVIRPEGRRNFGVLIEPQRPIPQAFVTNLSGELKKLHSLKGQWSLISVAGGACNDPCKNHLYLQRQLRESLGKEKERVDWVWLVSDKVEVNRELVPALNGATVLRVPNSILSSWLTISAVDDVAENLYVVDPLGNLMMRFPRELDLTTAFKAKRDLTQLLRASASWDQPGRSISIENKK